MRYEQYIGLGIVVVLIVLSRFGISPVGFLTGHLANWVAYPFYALANLILVAAA